jgi:hypothetical protein
MTGTATYVTIGGEAFDQIALKLYGRERFENVLMRENPQFNDVVKFDPNCVLIVPALAVTTNAANTAWGTIFLTQ